jgi:O-antigen ligase
VVINNFLRFIVVIYFASVMAFSFVDGMSSISVIIGLILTFFFLIEHIYRTKKLLFYIPIELKLMFFLIFLIFLVPSENIVDRLDLGFTMVKLFILSFVLISILKREDNILFLPFYGLALGVTYTTVELMSVSIAYVDASLRFGSSVGNSNLYASYLIFFSLISYGYLFFDKNWPTFKKILLLFIVSIVAFQIFLYTGSRKGMLIFTLLLLYFVFINVSRSRGVKKLFKYFAFTVLFSVFVYYILESPFWYRIENIFLFLNNEGGDTSISERWDMLVAGVNMLSHNPIFGLGARGYEMMSVSELGYFSYSHSNYLELLVNHGVIGFFTYYLIFILLIVKIYRRSKDNFEFRQKWAYWAYAVLAYRLIFDVQSVTYYDKSTWIVVALIVSLLFKYKPCNRM